MKRILSICLLFAALTACNTKKAENEKEQTGTAGECMYAYVADSTSFTWTAYKFTDKAPVKGTFNTITLTDAQTANSAEGVFTGSAFEIPVSGVNSNDKIRDPKIVEFFFGVMENSDVITGKVKSMQDGKIVFEITMNGVTKDVAGTYSVENNTDLTFDAGLMLEDFNAKSAVDSLNAACEALHTGADGVSILWSNVDLHGETTFAKDCM